MKRIYVPLLFLFLYLTPCVAQKNIPTVVVIDNIVREFDTKTPCTVSFWANKLENACKCCLIKGASDLDKGKKPSDILNSCLKANQCTQVVIDQLLEKENLTTINDKEQAIRDLITTLYDKSIIIEEVEPANIPLTAQGFFTENSLVNFLVRAHQEKKLDNPDFNDIACLSAKNEIADKGFQTLQLFSLSSLCSGKTVEYIFKEIGSGTKEIINLQKYFLAPPLVPYLYPKQVENFPSFILPTAYISYVYNGKAHYTSLMPKAPGLLLSSMISKYKNSLDTNKEVLQKAYYATGIAMSNFHRKFMDEFKELATPNTLLNPTYIHGDAHQANIFYDITTDRVTFIDNEKVATLSPKSPFYDIQFFILTALLFLLPPEFKSNPHLFNTWFAICAGGFLTGYVNAYPPNDRKKLLNELIATFNNPKSYVTDQLHQLYLTNKKTFDTIFNAINNQLKDTSPSLNSTLLSLNNTLLALRNLLG